MVRMQEKKPSRITVACNACRSRKQKCSGEKPICGQCVEHNRPCDWPEQLRRGPAKGYVEALEHRLRVTEGVLLRILHHVSDTELAAIFPEGKDPQQNTGADYIPLARLEKKGVEEWSRFPFDKATNIRKWQRVCTGQGTMESDNRTPEPDRSSVNGQSEGTKRKRFESSTPRPERSGNRPYSGATVARGGQGQSASPSNIHGQTPGENLHLATPSHGRSLLGTRFDAQSTSNTGVNEPISSKDLRSMQRDCAWDGAPSLSFQQQFLW